jgi:hypothetical protein
LNIRGKMFWTRDEYQIEYQEDQYMHIQSILTLCLSDGVPHNQHVNEIVTDMCISPLQLHPRIWNSKIYIPRSSLAHGRVLVNPETMRACIRQTNSFALSREYHIVYVPSTPQAFQPWKYHQCSSQPQCCHPALASLQKP